MRTALLATLVVMLATADYAARIPAQTRAQADLLTLKRCLEGFAADNGRPPTAQEGLGALVVNPDPVGLPRWRAHLDALPADPWGRPYLYVPPDGAHPQAFGVFSLGPDGVSRTAGNDPDDPNTWSPVQPRPALFDEATVWVLVPMALVGASLLALLVAAAWLLKHLVRRWQRSRSRRRRPA